MKKLLARLFRLVPLPVVRGATVLFNARFNISVVGVFLTPDAKVLVLRHVYWRPYDWGLPAGFMKAGETPEAAIEREVREEIGLEAKVTDVLAVHPVRTRHMQIVVKGTVSPDGAMCPSHEIFEGAFVTPDALPEGMVPNQKQIVRRAFAPPHDAR